MERLTQHERMLVNHLCDPTAASLNPVGDVDMIVDALPRLLVGFTYMGGRIYAIDLTLSAKDMKTAMMKYARFDARARELYPNFAFELGSGYGNGVHVRMGRRVVDALRDVRGVVEGKLMRVSTGEAIPREHTAAYLIMYAKSERGRMDEPPNVRGHDVVARVLDTHDHDMRVHVPEPEPAVRAIPDVDPLPPKKRPRVNPDPVVGEPRRSTRRRTARRWD